jgi:outer membrane murein-binding lipoprotein Lpp
MLFIIAASTLTSAVVLVYGGIKIKDQVQTVSGKVNTFTTQVNGINSNLQTINKSLQTANTTLQKQASVIPGAISNL